MLLKKTYIKRKSLVDFFGLIISGCLIILFIIGDLNLWFALMAVVLLLVWSLWSISNPLLAYGVIIFVWVNLFHRASIFIMPVEGYTNRGSLYLGNIMLTVFLVSNFIRYLISHKAVKITKPNTNTTIFLFPYLLFSILLPVLGIIGSRWPLSYATSAIRNIQWISIAVIAYLLCNKYSSSAVIRMTFKVLLLSCFMEVSYSVLQMVYVYLFPQKYPYLDKVFMETRPFNWLNLGRATGLAVNPNSLGLQGLVVMSLFLSFLLSGNYMKAWLRVFLGLASVWLIVSSGSRTAILTLFALLLFVAFIDVVKREKLSLLRSMGLIATILTSGAVTWELVSNISDRLKTRLSWVRAIPFQGFLSDLSFRMRVQTWQAALAYLSEHPFGSLVPPNYALQQALDSYWIYVIVQGSLIYLLMFILFTVGVIILGVKSINDIELMTKCAGYFLILVVLTALIGGISMVTFQDPMMIILLYEFIGIAIYNESKTIKRRLEL